MPTKSARVRVRRRPIRWATHITPQVDRQQSDLLGLTCEAPHSKISIVSIPLADPEGGTVRTKALSSDTEFYDPDGPVSAHGRPDRRPDGHAAGVPVLP